jgi:hypothetical protein
MKHIAPAWGSAKVNLAEMDKLREAEGQLQTRGIMADPSATQFPLITAKMQAADVKSLKKSFPRQGFVKEIDAVEAEGKKFAAEFGSKAAATPSAAWKMLLSAAYAARTATIQGRFKSFYTEWPQAKQRIPYTLMQEMRIVPELPVYNELVDKLFFELMDGKLSTPEEMKAFLEPYSPPAPPPPVHLRRARGTRKEPKAPKGRKKAAVAPEGELLTAALAKSMAEGADASGGELPVLEIGKKGAKPAAPAKTSAPVTKAAPAAKKAEPAKPVAKKAVKPAAKVVAKPVAKPAAKKVVAKKPGKPAPKKATKPVPKKPVKKKK